MKFLVEVPNIEGMKVFADFFRGNKQVRGSIVYAIATAPIPDKNLELAANQLLVSMCMKVTADKGHQEPYEELKCAAVLIAKAMLLLEAPELVNEELLKVLLSGRDLIASLYSHVSHGGPTRMDAEIWLKATEDAIKKAAIAQAKAGAA